MEITPDKWQRAKAVFDAALQQPPGERDSFLAAACLEDELRKQVEQLLLNHEQAGSFLSKPVIEIPKPERFAAGSSPMIGQTATSSSLAMGSRIGQYEIVARLDAGGMSDVYRARDLKLHREVAIKVLPAPFASDPDRLRRFQHEARIAASLNHPHVVTIHAIEESGGLHFLAMELVDGETLERVIPENGLPLEKFFDFAIPLSEALAAAHDKGIIHRDIKPRNIMIDRRGIVKMLDFGLAKVTEFAGGTHRDLTQSLSQEGTIIGTIPYMSPEQVQGHRLDARSDLFSLGAVLYQMATGRRPFNGRSTAELVSSILRDSPPPVTALRSDVPLALHRILEQCLAKDMAARYASARELCEAMARLRVEISSGQHTAALGATLEASVAVLPFTNMSTDPESEFFADGITEEIINALAQIKQLHVVARTSAFSFKGKHVDLHIIGERLNVRNVLTGSVRKSGNQLRITAQLQKVTDGFQLWSERYDRGMKDVFAIQDEIAHAIASRLELTLEGERSLVRAGTENLQAYQLYLKGRSLFFQRGPRLRRARECFERAVALDPKYALAWAGVADTYHMLAFYGLDRPELCLTQGKQAAERALELDLMSAEAHCARANIHLFYDREYSKAEADFLRALELNPGYLQARAWYGFFCLGWVRGRFTEAIQQVRQAVELDPLSSYARSLLAATYIIAGKFQDALQVAQAAVELDGEAYLAHTYVCLALRALHRFEDAAIAGEPALAISGRHPWIVGYLAMLYAEWGRHAEAEALAMELQWRAKREYVQPAVLSWVATAVGDRDTAVRCFEQAYETKDPILIGLKNWPFCEALGEDPRVQKIWTDLGLT
jgi:serine/threonine protein kinase/tetratricopeptide (TPR) repeat protein